MRLWKTILIICCIVAAVFFLREAGRSGCPFARSSAPAVLPEQPVADADSAAEESSRRLISTVSDVPVEWIGRNPAAKRARRIVPDPDWMTPDPVLNVGDVITLELFDDAVFDARIRNVTRYPNGSVGMTAHLTGEKTGTVYLSYTGGQLLVSVEVSGGADYAVIARNQAHYAIEIDQAESTVLEGLPPCVPDAVADSLSGDSTAAEGNVIDAPPGSTVVDVMIVYTPAATEWASTNGGIENVIVQAMQRANEAHTNSDTRVYLNLVHDAEVSYVESTVSTNYDVDLESLTDGDIENVHAWRDEYKADLVSMFVSVTNYGGFAWLLDTTNGAPDYAFSVARVQQVGWTYTVVHEWGHNMGCHHSTNQAISKGPTKWSDWSENTWSGGWEWDDLMAVVTGDQFTETGYCTIMTYEDSNNDGTNEYERVAYFSNPTNYYVGDSTNATGDAVDGDNARTIREMRAVLSAYRKAPDLDYDGIPNGWELEHFGGETNAIAGATASNGVNTVLETYIAGLDPNDPDSFFKTSATNGNGFVVHWMPVAGRVYSVFGTTNLHENFQPLATNIFSPQSSWTDTVERSESFYQINVELAE